jgi:hypothetical protein
VKQTTRTDGDANARARSFIARLSGVLQAQGHQALSDELFAILDDTVTTVHQAPRAVQTEFVGRYLENEL